MKDSDFSSARMLLRIKRFKNINQNNIFKTENIKEKLTNLNQKVILLVSQGKFKFLKLLKTLKVNLKIS